MRWGLRAAYFRRLLASANRIICPSRYVANYFQGFGAPPDKVVVIPNGTTDFGRARRHVQRPSNGASTGLRLAFLGAVVAHKGVHVAVQALQRARLPDVEFQVHGALPDPDYADCLTKLAAGVRGLTLRLSGPYKPTDVPKLLTNVDCLVAPSQVPESFSITVREAFACGIPVLASRLGGLGEAVREGVNGLTFTHDSPDELANLLVRVAGDAVLLAKLAGGARSSVVLSASGHSDAVRSEYAVAIGREHTCLRAVEGDSAETTMFNRLLHTEVPV